MGIYTAAGDSGKRALISSANAKTLGVHLRDALPVRASAFLSPAFPWRSSVLSFSLPPLGGLGGGECPGRGERATVFAVQYFVRSVLMKFMVYRLLECSPFCAERANLGEGVVVRPRAAARRCRSGLRPTAHLAAARGQILILDSAPLLVAHPEYARACCVSAWRS
jgi:hypothetical protein